MQFIDDHELRLGQMLCVAFLCQQNGERFGRGDEKGRWPVAKFGALGYRGIASPQVNAEFLFQSHAGNRCAQVFLDVVGECTQWGNINAAHARLQIAGVEFSKKRIKNTEESGKGLSTTGGRSEKDRFAF